MKKLNYNHTRLACYFFYIAAAAAFALPSLLFATFRELYGISYTLLGFLVVVCFITQLAVDLIFSFFSQHFNIHKTIRVMPLLTALGLFIYALVPMLAPEYAYPGFVLGTFIFSVSAGLGEVLISPTIAALPSDNKDRDMSLLHSIYGYGVVFVVVVSTLFLKIMGKENWMYLTFFWAVLPILASVFLTISPLPEMHIGGSTDKTESSAFRRKSMLLCMLCIILGACAECTITSWVSVYAEKALNIPKVYGDVFGMCLFAGLLAITRTAYAKYGKNIYKTLKVSMLCSAVLYVAVAFIGNPVISILACALLGVSTAMLWPGSLILMEEKIPGVGVAAYALMAAGGDSGASVAPQLMGIVIDNVALTDWAEKVANYLSLTPEQIGFKVGMLATAVFPILGFCLLLYIKKHFNKTSV